MIVFRLQTCMLAWEMLQQGLLSQIVFICTFLCTSQPRHSKICTELRVTRCKAPCPLSFDFYAGNTVITKSKAAGFFSLMMQLGSVTSWRTYFLRKKESVEKEDLLAQTGLLQLKLSAWWLLDEVRKANHIMCHTSRNLMGRLPSHSPWLKTSSNLKLIWQSSVAGKCTTYIFLNIVYLINYILTSEGTTVRYFSFLR